MRIEAATRVAPLGLGEFLEELGVGENGFGGTPVHTGEATLEQYLHQCCDMANAATVPPGLVPQTVYWVLDSGDQVVGMLRVRHRLTDRLRDRGGHVGFYVRRGERGQGYGRDALALALAELRRMGEARVLVTTDAENAAAIAIILANGGVMESTGHDSHRDCAFHRYWFDNAEPEPRATRDRRGRGGPSQT